MNKNKQASIEAMNIAIQSLTGKGLKVTQRSVVIECGLSIATIKRHWALREGVNQLNHPQS